jgi:tRNA (mo5U34)-methyltransferase
MADRTTDEERGASGMSSRDDLRERVAQQGQWYHTLELAPGVVTPGWFDTRPALDRIPFPADLTGRRCLDIATFDGFWGFAMEQRGAQEVLAIDLLDERSLDWPLLSAPATVAAIGERKNAGRGFEIAKESLRSAVERLEMSVYELDPAVVGTFDFVYIGSLLLHLKNPIGALERVRAVCRGELLAVDAIDLVYTFMRPNHPVATLDGVGRPWWFKPNQAGLVRMIEASGFEVTEPPVRFYMKPGAGQAKVPLRGVPRAMLHPAGREAVLRTYKGDPHVAVLARPAQ